METGDRRNQKQRATAALALTVGVFVLGGCTFLIDVQRPQCETDRDCVRTELGSMCLEGVCMGELPEEPSSSSPATDCDGGMCAPAPAFACGERDCGDNETCLEDTCLANTLYAQVVCEPDEPDGDAAGGDEPMASQMVTLKMHLQEYVSAEPPQSMLVQACRTKDTTCTSPVVTYVDVDGTGDIELALPAGFMGFLEVTGSDVWPSLWYLTRPLDRDREFKDLLVLSQNTLNVLASITGYTVDASKGLVILETFDCQGRALGGVHYDENKGSALPFYIVDEQPNVDVNVSIRNEVEDEAIGGFLNAEVGFSQFTAELGIDGPELGAYNARVAASTVTYIDIYRK